ncbi:hypothetical protein CEP54_013587 [Fusarium duplospermum]|uniref:Heterokaryon incompatibility domain-containing protein n=1 Tax=Fusarium duplospermum TaxID=1325734 RepID=A0A428P212_9HYPO|nr:hypothetical protein CEP54_013587 [Fusarium duplospermum]
MDPRVSAIRQRLLENAKQRSESPSWWHRNPRRITIPLISPPENCEKRERKVLAYDPLPTPTSIRLLQLHPEKLENEFDVYIPPRCSLIVKDLDDAPVYDALSYTWGCPVAVYSDARQVSSDAAWAVPAFDIICDGKPISVTANLYAALLSLRLRASSAARRYFQSLPQEVDATTMQSVSPPLNIWIDQICINQSDLEERSAQVMLMSRIYKQAEKCSIWLGGDDEFSRTGLETVKKLVAVRPEMFQGLLGTDIFSAQTYESMGIELVKPGEWVALYALLSRTWFWRSWVVQEAALPENLSFCCGILPITFDAIFHVSELLIRSDWANSIKNLSRKLQGHPIKAQGPMRSLHQPNPDDGPNLSMLRHLFGLRIGALGFSSFLYSAKKPCEPDPRSFSHVLELFHDLRATNPRDKIYAFLTLAEELGQVGTIVPDYKKPVEEVFRDAMQFLLQSSNSLNDLSIKEDPRRTKIPNLQSWVPDFTSDGRTSLRTHPGLSPWSAAGHLGNAHIAFHLGGVLEVRGLCIGTACAVHDLGGLANLGIGNGQESLLHLVKVLPEYSSIWIPPITPSLRAHLETHEMVPNKDVYHQVLIEQEGIMDRQSRLEVFWRTLLANSFGREFPPIRRTVDLLLGFWKTSLQTRMIAAGLCSDPDSLDGPVYGMFSQLKGAFPNWEILRSSISDMYRAQMFFKGEQSSDALSEAFPQGVAAILPELESAWVERRVSAKGQAMVREIINGMQRQFTTDDNEFQKQVEANCSGRRLFATNKGQLGLGPESTRTDDEFWVLAGADAPFVLRRQPDGRYSLIGEAYVHGAMFARPDPDLAAKDIKTVLII